MRISDWSSDVCSSDLINIVTKQPTTDFQAGFGASGGRYDNFRGEADISGPLNADGTIAARITGAYENSDSFVDFWHKTHGFVAPVIAFRPGPDTKDRKSPRLNSSH